MNAVDVQRIVQSAWSKIKPIERIFIDRFYEQIHHFVGQNDHIIVKDRFKVAEFLLTLTFTPPKRQNSQSADVLSIFSTLDNFEFTPSPRIIACAALNAAIDESNEVVFTALEREAFANVHLLIKSNSESFSGAEYQEIKELMRSHQ